MNCTKLKPYLQSCIQNPQKTLPTVIDIRNPKDFRILHASNSINICPNDLHERLYELPTKDFPIILIFDLNFEHQNLNDSGVAIQKSIQNKLEDFWILDSETRNQKQFENVNLCLEKLLSRGWYVEILVLWEELGNETVEMYKKMNVLSSGDLYYTLYKPNPSLKKQIEKIETNIIKLKYPNFAKVSLSKLVENGKSLTNCTNTKETKLKILDIGCGVGRDLGYLATRKAIYSFKDTLVITGVQEQDKILVDWIVYGIDSLDFCLVKARALLYRLGIENTMELYHATINKSGSIIPAKNSRDLETSQIFKILKDCISKNSRMSEYKSDTNEILKDVFKKDINDLPKTFDMVVSIRFLNIDFIKKSLYGMLNKGGIFFVSTFVKGVEGAKSFDKPSDSHCLKFGQLNEMFSEMNYDILVDEIEFIEDGRPINTFVAQKL
ncbi:hypothetical protein BB558_001113 [Smittium angustum]|uniref:Rhodanese domain-containing protein n=1 Tax=Smittium angustum TaxID=133377 RepID=A0A2U1JCK1_SMIAN|nr:hypothetical protein BB558_001113 [Smittium angustum]